LNIDRQAVPVIDLFNITERKVQRSVAFYDSNEAERLTAGTI
jgi:hypothetical protein